jgi:hypothetical protein
MTNTPRIVASLIFAAIAVFLVSYTWLPARDTLQSEEGKVTRILPLPNTWHEVEIITASGVRLTCRARRGWPLFGPSRCPLEEFEKLPGQTVNVQHDNKHPFEVAVGSHKVIEYSAHREAQMISIVLAGFMLAMAFLVWRRKKQ